MNLDFDKKIREVMNDPPDISPNQRVWQRIQHMLQNTPATNGTLRSQVFPILLILSVLSLLSTGYLYVQNKIKSNTIDQYKKILEVSQGHTTDKTDTIVHNHTTIIRDTIYQKTVHYITVNTLHDTQRKGASGTPSSEHYRIPAYPVSTRLSHFEVFLAQRRTTVFPDRVAPIHFYAQSPSPEAAHVSLPTSDNKNTRTATHIASSLPPLHHWDMAKVLGIGPAWIPLLGRYRYSTREKDASDRLNQLSSFFQKSSSQAVNSVKNISVHSTYTGMGSLMPFGTVQYESRFYTDVGVNFRLSKVLGITAGLEYIQYSFDQEFKNNGITPSELVGYPTVVLNSAQDRISEIYGYCSYFNVPLGLTVAPIRWGPFIPYLGVGTSASIPLSIELKYEAYSPTQHYELKKRLSLDRTLRFNNYWATLGLRYAWRDDLQLTFETKGQFYAQHINKYIFEDQQYLMAKVGALFIFKK